MLYAMPTVDAADRRVLEELGEMRSELQVHLRAEPRWEGLFHRSLLTDAEFSSIEEWLGE
ncbi:hypothetical protein [Actinoplanes sp. NPDC051494]|uniref:hypothetical protein n=1 Tax=Actinoplanes sp. NPDC051494 TaxID=3363907 RepID=UPI0037A30D44